MKKTLLFIFAGALLRGACASSQDYASRRKLTGIDYSAYERPVTRLTLPEEDFTAQLPEPTILEEGDLPWPAQPQAEEETQPSEDEDFTSEEIASSYGRYTDVTVVAAAKRVKLGAAANSKNMALFQKALDAAYKKALRTYRPSGFTYSISSVGAVNPLSDIEVSCILGEQAASDVGQPTCNLFFNTLVQQYNTLLKEAKENAAL